MSAKTATSPTAAPRPATVEFLRTGNPWIDAGIVGLYRVILRQPSYLEPIPARLLNGKPGTQPFEGVAVELLADRLVVSGPKEQVQCCLEQAYDCVIECYYSVSTKKQKGEAASHNFYLDLAAEDFVTFPKQRAAGAALLMFDKASRPAGTQEKWGIDPATGDRVPGRLPEDYTNFQPKLDALLALHRMKPGPPAGLLIGAGNQVRPKVQIKVGGKMSTEPDFLLGSPASSPGEAKQTAFPLFGGSRGFTSETQVGPRLSWETDFAGKFVPALCFFYAQDEDLYLFLPESSDLRRVAEVATTLQFVCDVEPHFFHNFKLNLGGYFSGRSETTFAFLHRLFQQLSSHRRSEAASNAASDVAGDIASEARSGGTGETVDFPGSDDEDDDAADDEEDQHLGEIIEPQSVYQALAAVNVAVVAARKKGNVWMGRDFFSFTDLLYLARLLGKMTASKTVPGRPSRCECDPKRLMTALIDFSAAKDKTLVRDRVCDFVLRRQSVLRPIERHAVRLFNAWQPGEPRRLGPLLDFLTLYEPALRGDPVEKQVYDDMVSRAQWLGRNIAEGVCKAGPDTEKNESAGRSKGVFFRLRRARRTGDFLNELARLQLRYRIDVPPKSLDADCFREETFAEYRGFCVIAALHRFQYLSGRKGGSAGDAA